MTISEYSVSREETLSQEVVLLNLSTKMTKLILFISSRTTFLHTTNNMTFSFTFNFETYQSINSN